MYIGYSGSRTFTQMSRHCSSLNLLFYIYYRQERDAELLCCIVYWRADSQTAPFWIPQASAGQPNPSKDPSGLGWCYTQHHHCDGQSSWSPVPLIFSRYHWSLTSVWFLQGLVEEHFQIHLLFVQHPPNIVTHTSLPLRFLKCRKPRALVHLKLEKSGMSQLPTKRSLTPSTDGLHPVLKYVQRLLFLK